MDPEDADIVRSVLEGYTESYRVLVRRYQDLLFRHAIRMVGDADEAADLVQETFVRGFRKLRRCRNPARVGAWLFRIGANLCKDHLKSPRRRAAPLEGIRGEAGVVSAASSPERIELRTTLERALGDLNADQREAFLLRHLEGFGYEEMAALLGITVPAAKMRVHRAREELRKHLEDVR